MSRKKDLIVDINQNKKFDLSLKKNKIIMLISILMSIEICFKLWLAWHSLVL